MDVKQHNITIGTAGHVDHGKTALVKLLTGCDTDRLKIEKERGMSIELGFAPCVISGVEVGIVDVPGHEDFIKTMVAGATGIDACILVVAADDGIMPQTREHMDIMSLLGVSKGIVALTKIDIVPQVRVQEVIGQLRAYLAGTFLANAPIIPLSNVTGQGLEDFLDAMKGLVEAIEPRSLQGVFRLPVERAFSVKGYGTVVTGVPVSGCANVGDELVLLPQGLKGRVRAIQVYGRDSLQAVAGQCAALNIPQWDHKAIQRGNVVTASDYFEPNHWYLCRLRLLDTQRQPLRHASEVRFHTGTSETLANVYLFQPQPLAPGCECLVQILLRDPLVAGPCDRFIVRSLTPPRTIGGGLIIEALPRRLRRTHKEVLDDIEVRQKAVREPMAFVEYCIMAAAGQGIDGHDIAIRTKMMPAAVAGLLGQLLASGRVVKVGSSRFIHLDAQRQIRERLLDMVGAFHQRTPEYVGIGTEELLAQAGLPRDVFDAVLDRMVSEGHLIRIGDRLALPGHSQRFDSSQQKVLDTVEALFRSCPFNPPGLQQVVEETRIWQQQAEWAINVLCQQQRLIQVDKELWFHKDAVEAARQRLTEYIQQHGRLESVRFKYILDTTRKYAIPLLDYFDRIGLTRRDGYTRYLR